MRSQRYSPGNSRLIRVLATFALVAMTGGTSHLIAENKPAPPPKDLVKAEAHLSTERLPAGDKCQILIRLTIHEGWHTYANPPKSEEDIPTEVEFKGKLGTKLVKIKYPVGAKYDPMDGEPPKLVYDGRVDIRGVLEVPASASGENEEMEITVKFQACDDSRCLRPDVVKLKGKLPVSKLGEPVKLVNEKLFPPQP